MVNQLVLSLLFLLSSVVTWGLETKPLRSIKVTHAFDVAIQNPSQLSYCGGKLWVFSELELQLFAVDPTTGEIKAKFSLQSLLNASKAEGVSALACQQSELYILINGQKNGGILELHVDDHAKFVKKYPLPLPGRATDLFCNLDKCWILQDRPMITYNFNKWLEIWAPFPAEMKRVYAHPDLNPFEDWQATLNVAQGKYTKGAIDKFGQFVLIDPFHSQAIIRTGAEWEKWGNFGVWEGSFLAPKAITFLTEDILAVADAKLKAIFIFRRDGLYLGVLALEKDKIFAPDYPLGLAVVGGRLFVSDFRVNKVSALDMKTLSANFEAVSKTSVRQNLFRREEVLKDSPSTLCLNCHDGTISNQLHKFLSFKRHHPLECSQCHDPHHTVKSQNYLREPAPMLCQKCHKDYSDPKVNHLWNAKAKSGGTCTDCHHGHSNNAKLLVTPVPEICTNCHKEHPIQHLQVSSMTDLNTAKSVILDNGKFSCITCHQTHINWKETHFIKDPQKILSFCASCHGEKSPQLLKNFHKIMKTKTGVH